MGIYVPSVIEYLGNGVVNTFQSLLPQSINKTTKIFAHKTKYGEPSKIKILADMSAKVLGGKTRVC